MMAGPPADRPPASETLQLLGFTPFETVNLLELKRRYEQGAFGDTPPTQRLRFARWLVRNGRLSDGQADPPSGACPYEGCIIRALPHIGGSSEPDGWTIVSRRTVMAMAERRAGRSRLGPSDRRAPGGEAACPIGAPVGRRHRPTTAVVAIVILLSVLGVFAAHAWTAAFGG